jgi:hypothetical protein
VNVLHDSLRDTRTARGTPSIHFRYSNIVLNFGVTGTGADKNRAGTPDPESRRTAANHMTPFRVVNLYD